MPLIMGAKVQSLVETCVRCITENLDHWCNKPVSEVIHVINPELAKSPFDELPLAVLKKIIYELERKSSVKNKFLELLLSPQLDSLDLAKQKERHVGDLLYLASIKCMNLKKLQLCGLKNVGTYMVFFLPKFENLQVLEVANSFIGDHCLQLLGVCCKNLRELNILGCNNISDEGVKGLCVSVDNYGKEDSRLGQCKLIEKLATNGTSITKVGKKILLENLLALKIWDAAHFGWLAKLFVSDPYLLKNPPKYSFTQLELNHHSFFSVNSLKMGVLVCPFLMKIEINAVDGLMDSELLSLLSLKNLRKLKISGFDTRIKSGGITFIEGVIPLLKCLGSSLEKLELRYLHRVDILVIRQFCPNLRSLALRENWSYSTPDRPKAEYKYRSNPTNGPFLQLLEELRLDGDFEDISKTYSNRPLPDNIVLLLLSLPTLTEVTINACGNLTDEILHKAEEIHHFQKLVYLKIFYCSSVTRKGINVFLSNRNPLRKMELFDCLQLTNQDVRYWRRQKREENWHLDIEFRELESFASGELDRDSEFNSVSDSGSVWANEWGEDYCESDNDFDSVNEWADTDNVDVKNLQ